jgi:hypothetical protein
MMEAVHTSETLAHSDDTKRRYIQEDSKLQQLNSFTTGCRGVHVLAGTSRLQPATS